MSTIGPETQHPASHANSRPAERARARTTDRHRTAAPGPNAPPDLLALQRTAGNRAASQLVRGEVPAGVAIQLWPWSKKSKADATSTEATPYVITVGTEKIQVANAAEEKEAKAICARLKKDFGVTLSSPTSIEAIKAQYGKVKKETLDSLETNTWAMKELRGVQAAVAHYAPIMGKQRGKSSLADRAQGITSLGRVKKQVDANYKDAPLIEGVMGEYMSSKNNVTLFDAATDLVDGRYLDAATGATSNATTIEANAVHEMAHGLIQPVELANWVAKLDFWLDANTASGAVDAEVPPTPYGQSNAREDICESAAIFFTNRARLEQLAPLRAAFLAKVVEGWTPPTKKAAVKKAKTAKGSGK